MKRADAVALYGSHYIFNTHSRTLYEVLGHPRDDDNEDAHDADSALEEMKDRLTDSAMARIAKIDTIFARPGNKVLLFLAQRGWHNRSESILAGADKLRTERKALEADVTSDFEGKIKTEPLPADIKIPVALEPGREVYVVRACYLEEGIRMTTAKITDRNLWQGSSSRGDWHYIFTYNAKDERGQTLSFEYNHADASEPEIKNNIHGVRYFLNREAAEDHILELATRMSAHFSAVALDHRLRVIDRKKTNGGPAAPQP